MLYRLAVIGANAYVERTRRPGEPESELRQWGPGEYQVKNQLALFIYGNVGRPRVVISTSLLKKLGIDLRDDRFHFRAWKSNAARLASLRR